MRRTVLLSTSAICTAIAGALLLSPATAQKLPPYDPYPDDILPPKVLSEIHRVQREIRGIFQQYLLQLQQLGPLTVTGNPPTIQGNGYEAQRILGGLLNYDLNMSPLRNVACSSCHMPYAGFSGPIPSVNLTMVAYPGSYHYRAGKRTAQRYTYSPYFPVLSYDTTQGAFFGGNFWDGRSTGYLLQSPDAEQAQHPPVDTQEMANPDTACIAYKLSLAKYRPLFEAIWGAGSLDIQFPANTADICSIPGGAAIFGGNATPIALSPDDRTKANSVFNHWGQSISFLEHSTDISPFTSKIDANLKGNYTYTADEAAGAALFRGKGNCNSCHLDGTTTTLTPTQTDTGTRPTQPPCSPASAMQISACRSIPGTPFTIRPCRIASGSQPTPTASATEIWGWAPSSEAALAPRPIQTRNGCNTRPPPTDSCRPLLFAMWP